MAKKVELEKIGEIYRHREPEPDHSWIGGAIVIGLVILVMISSCS